MTHREAFEKAKAHLLAQNAKAQGPKIDSDYAPQCAYRAPDGKKCAIGCLITDEEYKPEYEGKNIAALVCDHGKDLSSLQGLHVEFLCALQGVHDRFPPYEWPSRLDYFEHYWKRLF